MKAAPYRMRRNRPAIVSYFYSAAAFLLMLFALPKLPPISGSFAGVFCALWLLTALLVIGANLYHALSAGERQGRMGKFSYSELYQMQQTVTSYRSRQVDKG